MVVPGRGGVAGGAGAGAGARAGVGGTRVVSRYDGSAVRALSVWGPRGDSRSSYLTHAGVYCGPALVGGSFGLVLQPLLASGMPGISGPVTSFLEPFPVYLAPITISASSAYSNYFFFNVIVKS